MWEEVVPLHIRQGAYNSSNTQLCLLGASWKQQTFSHIAEQTDKKIQKNLLVTNWKVIKLYLKKKSAFLHLVFLLKSKYHLLFCTHEDDAYVLWLVRESHSSRTPIEEYRSLRACWNLFKTSHTALWSFNPRAFQRIMGQLNQLYSGITLPLQVSPWSEVIY